MNVYSLVMYLCSVVFVDRLCQSDVDVGSLGGAGRLARAGAVSWPQYLVLVACSRTTFVLVPTDESFVRCPAIADDSLI